MPTESSIKNTASTAKSSRGVAISKNNPYDRGASSLSITWKGEVSEAFKEATRRVKSQMTSVINEYDSLNTKLTKLSSSVKRAENEEKKKAAVKAK
jgi:uncharacterized protein YukE